MFVKQQYPLYMLSIQWILLLLGIYVRYVHLHYMMGYFGMSQIHNETFVYIQLFLVNQLLCIFLDSIRHGRNILNILLKKVCHCKCTAILHSNINKENIIFVYKPDPQTIHVLNLFITHPHTIYFLNLFSTETQSTYDLNLFTTEPQIVYVLNIFTSHPQTIYVLKLFLR